jgi:hypothetical protein
MALTSDNIQLSEPTPLGIGGHSSAPFVRFGSKTRPLPATMRTSPARISSSEMCQFRTDALQQPSPLFEHLFGAGE